MALLNTNTSITLGAAAAVVLTSITVTAWLNNKLNALSVELASLRADVTKLQGEQYTTSMAEAQALRMAIENPGLRVPDPRNPGQVIVVDKSRTIGGV